MRGEKDGYTDFHSFLRPTLRGLPPFFPPSLTPSTLPASGLLGLPPAWLDAWLILVARRRLFHLVVGCSVWQADVVITWFIYFHNYITTKYDKGQRMRWSVVVPVNLWMSWQILMKLTTLQWIILLLFKQYHQTNFLSKLVIVSFLPSICYVNNIHILFIISDEISIWGRGSGLSMGPQGPQLRGAQAKRGLKEAHFQAI